MVLLKYKFIFLTREAPAAVFSKTAKHFSERYIYCSVLEAELLRLEFVARVEGLALLHFLEVRHRVLLQVFPQNPTQVGFKSFFHFSLLKATELENLLCDGFDIVSGMELDRKGSSGSEHA